MRGNTGYSQTWAAKVGVSSRAEVKVKDHNKKEVLAD
jgi:hypothetical protein